MKRFIIGISAIILLVFIGFIAVFYGGFYVDSNRDNHINTFVRTENKEILIKDKDKWKPFEVRLFIKRSMNTIPNMKSRYIYFRVSG